MDFIGYEEINSVKTKELIDGRKSFKIVGLSGRMSSAVSQIEQLIESKNLSCRVLTNGRIAAAGGSFFGGITGVLGVVSAIGIAAHNIATYDPDYEIIKHPVDNKLSITYKK